jgi:ABC-type antimicrobial peptide transport system permease subunit
MWRDLSHAARRLARSPGFAALTAFSAYVSRLGRFDPVILALLTTALVAVTVLASLVPAWRATRVDPVQALRCD